MQVWEFALWGAVGSGCVEALEFITAIRRTRDWPWKHKESPGAGPLATSIVIRVGVGAALAMVLGAGGVASGPMGAYIAGLAAPVIIERLAKQVKLDGGNSSGAIEPPNGDGAGDEDAR